MKYISYRAIVGLAIIVAAVALLALLLVGPTHASCSVQKQHYTITIEHDRPSISHLTAQRCDMLTFKNIDPTTREIAFGPHAQHVPYDGVAERILSQGQSFTITLNQTGNFQWHDHVHDDLTGTFTVNK